MGKLALTMTILLINFCGFTLLVTVPRPGVLSHRLAALWSWCSGKNWPVGQ